MTGAPAGLGLWVLLACLGVGFPLKADSLRVATYDVDMSYSSPGMALDQLAKGRAEGVTATVAVIVALDADVLLLTGIDFDADNAAITALADLLRTKWLDYPHVIALRPNSGVASGRDLNGDGALNSPDDALAWGRFPGNGGMAVLSRYPIATAAMRDLTPFRWADLPGGLMPDFIATVAPDLPLSTSGHWIVPVDLPDGSQVQLLAYAATPPVFDDDRDLNGRRNHDEAALWARLLDGNLPGQAAPPAPFVLLGKSSLDPLDGDGRRDALRDLLAHPSLQDPAPKGPAQHHDKDHQGDPAMDTALYDRLGGLRVDLILPSRDLVVTGSGVMWVDGADPMAAVLQQASRHRPVWVDVEIGE